MQYLSDYGQERIIDDLKTLTLTQKEMLVCSVFEIMQTTSNQNTDEDWGVAMLYLEKIGISEDFVEKTIFKYGTPKF